MVRLGLGFRQSFLEVIDLLFESRSFVLESGDLSHFKQFKLVLRWFYDDSS